MGSHIQRIDLDADKSGCYILDECSVVTAARKGLLMKDNILIEDNCTTLYRINRQMEKIVNVIERCMWVSMALAGIVALASVLIKQIDYLELTVSQPVLIQACLSLPYIALIAFLMTVVKLQKKPYGLLVLRLLTYSGIVWFQANITIVFWPYISAVFN